MLVTRVEVTAAMQCLNDETDGEAASRLGLQGTDRTMESDKQPNSTRLGTQRDVWSCYRLDDEQTPLAPKTTSGEDVSFES
jgi:hypothetical protein